MGKMNRNGEKGNKTGRNMESTSGYQGNRNEKISRRDKDLLGSIQRRWKECHREWSNTGGVRNRQD